jgi:hypothetical protein
MVYKTKVLRKTKRTQKKAARKPLFCVRLSPSLDGDLLRHLRILLDLVEVHVFVDGGGFFVDDADGFHVFGDCWDAA